jgi:CRP-like cAMP-binding protein
MMLKRGDVLFKAGDAIEALYWVETGRMRLEVPADTGGEGSGQQGEQAGIEYGAGSFITPQDLYTSRKATRTCTCFSADSRVVMLPRNVFPKVLQELPEALHMLQVSVGRAMSLDVIAAQEISAGQRQ